MNISMVMSLIMTAIGFIYTFSTLALPDARIGIPYEPKVFPGVLGICLIAMGFVLIIQEMSKRVKTEPTDATKRKFIFNTNSRNIALTVLNGLLYAVLFSFIGYVFSTIVFLEIQLYIFRGLEPWKNSTLVAVVFAVIAYLLFTSLGIYLPTSPLGFI